MDLLLLNDDDKLHYVYIKDFNRFMFHKIKNKKKKWFCKNCLQCFSSDRVLIKHKENRFSINSKQSAKLEKGTIKFENYFKQIPVPFKIYADFECNSKSVQLTKKVPVIFHNLRGCDSHLIFNKLDKFDVKINVIPNSMDSIQFLNSSLDKLLKTCQMKILNT